MISRYEADQDQLYWIKEHLAGGYSSAGFTSGDKVAHQGENFFVYDFMADYSQPERVVLVLITSDFKMFYSGVPVSEVERK